MITLSFIGGLRTFDLIWAMTRGGPGSATEFIAVLIERVGNRQFDIGMAAAQSIIMLALTIVLGVTFLGFQAVEYVEAYRELGLTLGSGIYGSTFFMLTGFHGAHVTLGTVMLAVMLVRILRGHFDAEHQFGFEAASWYWHFVDVVWIALFVFVYVL